MGTSAKYAAGRRALGLCDRCGFPYKLHELVYEVFDQHLNGLRVCHDCKDHDHPQLQLGEIIIADPESLYDPRPDLSEQTSTEYFGWRPVGNPITQTLKSAVGSVTIVIT